jgi:hypothetical protein
MRCSPFVLVLVLLATASPLPAQTLDGLIPGMRVRVSGGIGSSLGIFDSFNADTLWIAFGMAEPTAIPMRGLLALHVLQPRSRAQGALVGVKWGAPIGALFLAIDCWSDVDDCRQYYNASPDLSSDRTVLRAGVTGLMGGAMLGAMFGAIWPGTRELEVQLPRGRPVVELAPNGGLSVRVPF